MRGRGLVKVSSCLLCLIGTFCTYLFVYLFVFLILFNVVENVSREIGLGSSVSRS